MPYIFATNQIDFPCSVTSLDALLKVWRGTPLSVLLFHDLGMLKVKENMYQNIQF
jgi:hypothetical protein